MKISTKRRNDSWKFNTNDHMHILNAHDEDILKMVRQVSGDGEDQGSQGRWWERVLDLEEAKKQLVFSLPMILTNAFYYLITLICVMFAGHLGELQLAGATLSNSWATVTGFCFMIGLSGALETLCGQDLVQSYTEYPQISKTAALYAELLIPGLFAFGFLHNILRFFQTQSVVMPLVVFSVIPLLFDVGLTYSLVHWTSLGFKGAPLAASVSLWLSILVLAAYVAFAKEFKHTWTGFSLESFHYILTNLRLALPSADMFSIFNSLEMAKRIHDGECSAYQQLNTRTYDISTSSEYWAFEILVFLAGLMPNSKETTSLIAMCVTTETIAYMLTCGLSAVASTRASNELGAGNLKQAKKAMVVTLKLSMLVALAVGLALVLVMIYGLVSSVTVLQ
ncbi:hypothetical protein FEM48_Zijuj12G0104600 [Ziziphus jujuba var. spinosa]|uniref:Uncharacterized protein n=1 Tax=Ziziphus jujuba var. spinosa TaxID=714518 RepID=A0A978UCS7_ZIZJJ|nr:hypothetical protein FEM48_Zijuj12G0104600 [Ziziphus jujuba var. spinosa]